MKRLFSSSWMPLVLASLVFFILQARIYNLGLGFRDEGYLFLNAAKIMAGEVPYRDFFMTTTPGSFYLIAFVNKLFGTYILWDRIMYFVFVFFVLFLVNLIYKLEQVKNYVVLISLALLFIGTGVFAYYNIEALVFVLAGFLFLNTGLINSNKKLLFVSGVFVGFAFIFKQSYGGWAGLSFLLIIFSERLRRFGIFDSMIWSYISGVFTILVPFTLYFYLNDALSQFLYYIGIFSREVKSHRTPFVIKSILVIPIIFIGVKLFGLRILKFIRTFYKPILIALFVLYVIFEKSILGYAEISRVYYAGFIIFPTIILASVKSGFENSLLRHTAILLLGLFLANASSGRELGAVMWVSPLYLPLIILSYDYFTKIQKINKPILTVAVFGFIVFQGLYFSISSVNLKTRNSELNSGEMRHEILTPFTSGIKVSAHTKKETENLLTALAKFPKNQKLLCFPYCPMINPLSGRESPSYFNFFYPEAFLPSHQDSVIREIKESNPILVIQRKGLIEREANYEDQRFEKLKRFIVNNHKKIYESKEFEIYE